MKTAVVTGATGFIGNALTRKLIQEGVFVYAVGRSEKKLESLSRLQNVAVIQARFEEYGSLAEKVNCAPDVLYHCAYAGGFSADALKDYSLQLDNAKYACAAVESAIGMHCKKFVLTSTVNTAEILTFLNTENFSPRFTCIYSAAKLASELMGKTLAHQGGMQFCTALIAMPYGEGNLSQTLPNIVIRQLKNCTSPKLIEGNHLYDLIYIDDVAEGLLAIGKCGKDFRDYYVGHRKLMTFRSWITKIRDAISPEMELRFGEYPDAPALDYRFLDLDALFRDSGFEAAADFESSIQRTAEWLIKMEGNGNGGGARFTSKNTRFLRTGVQFGGIVYENGSCYRRGRIYWRCVHRVFAGKRLSSFCGFKGPIPYKGSLGKRAVPAS